MVYSNVDIMNKKSSKYTSGKFPKVKNLLL